VKNEFADFWGGASWRSHQILRPNEAVFWCAMRRLKERGIPLLDMGGGGAYKEEPLNPAWHGTAPCRGPRNDSIHERYKRVNFDSPAPLFSEGQLDFHYPFVAIVESAILDRPLAGTADAATADALRAHHRGAAAPLFT
jgi:hypothetical protein